MANFEMATDDYNAAETVETPELIVSRLNDGLGYGEGLISGKPEGVSEEILARIDRAIEHDARILVPVAVENGQTIEDDGCGDGRGVHTAFRGQTLLKRSLHRAKVFGGSVAMAAASRIGLGKSIGKDLQVTFGDAIDDLQTAHIDFGAHTDEAADTDNESSQSGCGAIDKAPVVVPNVIKYQNAIRDAAIGLGADAEDVDSTIANYASYAPQIADKPYSGKKVVRGIADLGKVVKRLAGAHKEARIVLNTVKGYTVNQQFIREISGDAVDVFAVDVWRMQEIAERLHPQNIELQRRSFTSQLVYTLGVAGTLTKGDLPTYLVSAARKDTNTEA